MKKIETFIMFTDIKGFSSLNEKELEVFVKEVWPNAFKVFEKYSEEILGFNTWGDAIFMVFKKTSVIRAILNYRDYFRNTRFEDMGLKPLGVRIGCHYGEFYEVADSVTKRSDFIGTTINTAARVEPVTRINDIFVTQEFVDAINNKELKEELESARLNIEFDPIGLIPLAKDFGKHDISLLRYADDDKNVIDKMVEQNLIEALPDAEKISDIQKTQLENHKISAVINLEKEIADIITTGENSEYILGLAKLCKEKGLYKKSLDIIKKLENFEIEAEGVMIYPYRSRIDLMKIKANALSRLNKYQDASEIIYSLWKSGANDGDTLCMLAAQYKRRAVYDDNNELKEDYDDKLLKRAYSLYLEAFRRNINDYYPAVNAAYIAVIIGEKFNGRLLANYVKSIWKKEFGTNWWVSSAIAESGLINEDPESINLFEVALNKCNPNIFDVEATKQQIGVYRFFNKGQKLVDDALGLLEDYLLEK